MSWLWLFPGTQLPQAACPLPEPLSPRSGVLPEVLGSCVPPGSLSATQGSPRLGQRLLVSDTWPRRICILTPALPLPPSFPPRLNFPGLIQTLCALPGTGQSPGSLRFRIRLLVLSCVSIKLPWVPRMPQALSSQLLVSDVFPSSTPLQ